METNDVGFMIHSLDRQIGKRVRAITAEHMGDDMPISCSWILNYIRDHQDDGVFQKDIERAFGMPPSSVTKQIKQLEKNGYILRNSVERDARLKKLRITDKAAALQENITNDLHHRVNDKLTEGISSDEMKVFYRVVEQMKINICSDAGSWDEVCHCMHKDMKGKR